MRKDSNHEIIDRKFLFLAINPFNRHMYTEKNAMVFCAKDKALPATLNFYREECKRIGAGEDHILSVGLLLDRVMEYQHLVESRVPDTIGVEAEYCLGLTSDRKEI
jgi:hypothetical protein